MSTLQRLRTRWSGNPGLPGVTTVYATDMAVFQPAWEDLLQVLKSYIPNNISWLVENTGDVINVENGDLVGGWSGGDSTPIAGLNASPFTAPAGFQVVWETGIVLDSKHVRGRTFFVPATGTMYDDTGSLDNTLAGEVQAACLTFLAGGGSSMNIWRRPRKVRPAVGSLPLLPARDGAAEVVTSAHVPDKAVVLTSRRD